MPRHATYQVMSDPRTHTYRVFHDGAPLDPEITPGTPAWITWLETIASFSFVSASGASCTVRKENVQRGGAYWYAYRRTDGRTAKRYLGLDESLTLERLEETATTLAGESASVSRLPASNRPSRAGSRDAARKRRATQHRTSQTPAPHLLLMTKMRLPRTPTRAVNRPHVLGRLQRGLERPLTVVAAPAGFGKTTALCDWARQVDMPVAWVSLDAGDNDPAQFWTYAFAALNTAVPRVADDALAMLAAPQPPPLTAILRTALNALATLDGDVALVLDDYHLITTPAIHDSLAFLLEHPPAQLHLYLALRGEPPLTLGRLRTYGQVNEITDDHLRFRPDEAAAFLDDVMGVSLTVEQVMQVAERTDGWIAGIQLAGLSLQEHPDFARFIAGFSGSHRNVVMYLGEEVLAAQPEEVQAFLLRTAVLERMCAPLCDAVTGRTDGRVMLERLERSHLFLFALDDERRWYRYYHLFADVLRHRLREQTGEDVAGLHRRAAHWLEHEGLIFEAVDHLFAIPDLTEAASMIERAAGEILSHGEVTPLLSLISRLPEDIIVARPHLCLYQAQAFFSHGQLDAAEQRIAQAEEGMAQVLTSQPDTPEAAALGRQLASGVAVGRAVLAAMRGDAAETLAFAQRGLAEIADDETADRGGAILTLGHARGLSGDMRGAEAAYEEASRLCLAAGNLYLATTALLQQAGACAWMGRTRQAAEIYRRVVEMAETRGGAAASLAGGAWSGLAGRLYEWNDLAAAGQALQRVIALGEQWANDEDQVDGFARLALVRLAEGRTTEALESLSQAQDLVRSGAHYPWIPVFTAALAARIALRTGQMEDATRWAREHAPDLVPGAHLTVFDEYEYLTLARVLIAGQQPDEALGLLDGLRNIAQAEERVSSLIEIGALTALAWQAEDNTMQALEALQRAAILAEAEGYVRTFVDEGIPMRGVLVRLRERQQAGRAFTRYLNGLIAAFDPATGTAVAARASDRLIEPLSEREREVLRLLAEGRSNQEIARALVVAPSTVKTHVHHIFAKIQASDRLQAVTRARAFGLLER